MECIYLIPIGCDDADALMVVLVQPRKNFLPDDVDLTLIDVSPRVVSRNGPIQGQHIQLIMIFCHDDQLTVIEFLVAEIDDFRVAAVVFSQ